MIRRFGSPPKPDHPYTPRPGVYAVLLHRGDMLVTQEDRSDVGLGVELQLPGGGIDPGESPLMALHREVIEETGWRIARAQRLGAFRRFVYMPEYDKWADKLCTIYLAQPVISHGPPTETGHRAIWLPGAVAATQLAGTGDRHFAMRALQRASGTIKF